MDECHTVHGSQKMCSKTAPQYMPHEALVTQLLGMCQGAFDMATQQLTENPAAA